jgi:serine/alanine adding enzyme
VTGAGGEWRQIPRGAGPSTLAHAPEWFTVIRRAYGHEPLYFVAEAGREGRALLPAFVVRRPLFGTVVASMPFLDGGGPCASSPVLTRALVERLLIEARSLGARFVDLRSTGRLPVAAEPMQHKVTLALRLWPDADRIWRHVDKQVRNQVRKAERCGLTIENGGTGQLNEFYDVFAARMRDLGSPVHSPEFLRATAEEFGDRARIVLVRQGRAAIGGLVALAFNDTLSIPWAACLREYFPLCPNMLLYWEIIRTACRDGFARFDFGRSTIGSGTCRFKRQWGAREEPLFWYTIPIGAQAGASASASALTTIWRHLPLPVTRALGPRVRRYLIQ